MRAKKQAWMIPKKLRRNQLARTVGIPLYRLVARGVFFYPPPRVLVNAIPKAGLHLLETLLDSFPKMMHSGVYLPVASYASRPLSELSVEEVTGRENGSISWDTAQLRRTLSSVRDGQFVTGHLPAIPSLLEVAETMGFRHLLIVRDPRDIVVSGAFYLADRKRNSHWNRFNEEFSSTEARIMALIRGFTSNASGPGNASIGVRVGSFMPLVNAPGIHTSRFESLVGAKGGGDPAAQRREVESIARFLGRDLGRSDADRIIQKTWSTNSATFRKGSIGDWRTHFTAEHKEVFKEIAGDHLITLGYETDYNW